MDKLSKCVLTGVAALGLGALWITEAPGVLRADPFETLADSVVKIHVGGGHGSGVHLGNGYVLTAGHVTDGQKAVKVQTTDDLIWDGEVLLSNYNTLGNYDVSLVYVEAMATINEHGTYEEPYASANLSCNEPYVGQNLRIIGNPSGDEFASSWGRVSNVDVVGFVEKGWWRVLVGMDITAAPGVSGGPVFDDISGEVVGILVAGLITDRGTFGYSYMVPGDAICHVLGRSA